MKEFETVEIHIFMNKWNHFDIHLKLNAACIVNQLYFAIKISTFLKITYFP